MSLGLKTEEKNIDRLALTFDINLLKGSWAKWSCWTYQTTSLIREVIVWDMSLGTSNTLNFYFFTIQNLFATQVVHVNSVLHTDMHGWQSLHHSCTNKSFQIENRIGVSLVQVTKKAYCWNRIVLNFFIHSVCNFGKNFYGLLLYQYDWSHVLVNIHNLHLSDKICLCCDLCGFRYQFINH